MRARTVFITGIAAFAGISCRDGVAPFANDPIDGGGEPLLQLTFNVGDEGDPQWSQGGDTVYFHSDFWYALPGYRGSLQQVPVDGGIATRLAPAAQPTPAPKLLLPVPAPHDPHMAYLHLRRERTASSCQTFDEKVCPLPTPRLDTAAIRVRSLDAGTSTFDDPGVTVAYESGSTSIEPPFVERLPPFQLDYGLDNQISNVRASWAPAGDQLVYSDGLRLLLWRVGEPEGSEIPNTTDGVAPAWSPDGQWIAFGVLVRGEPFSVSCLCPSPGNNPFVVTRHGWELTARQIALVRPDGSDMVVLTEGSEPAWAPDGSALYFRRGDAGLFRIPPTGGAETALANTHGARAPAVSPDGGTIAFTRRGPRGDFNIWRLRLQP